MRKPILKTVANQFQRFAAPCQRPGHALLPGQAEETVQHFRRVSREMGTEKRPMLQRATVDPLAHHSYGGSLVFGSRDEMLEEEHFEGQRINTTVPRTHSVRKQVQHKPTVEERDFDPRYPICSVPGLGLFGYGNRVVSLNGDDELLIGPFELIHVLSALGTFKSIGDRSGMSQDEAQVFPNKLIKCFGRGVA